ncbi:ABC transporter, ATP-binding/permease protein [Streptococcus mitis]|uniref:ABC transporter, ATP-binding/permease protein n=1 Tax=Streptococcus mitis TaxID=28037 RepID=A0A150NX05_STRMT|nr:ABC transporter, ATP-binding/permease protein [Streptococcus mitis]KYF38005.1 ABC transporter, ATP-binding/permease protein [Streptococcus mitis]
MKRQTANQTLSRLAKDLASHPFLLFLAFLGTIAQVGLSIYLPILIGQVIDQVLVAGSSPVFLADFHSNGLGSHRKYPCTVDQSSPL